jgi:hypothetical protein
MQTQTHRAAVLMVLEDSSGSIQSFSVEQVLVCTKSIPMSQREFVLICSKVRPADDAHGTVRVRYVYGTCTVRGTDSILFRQKMNINNIQNAEFTNKQTLLRHDLVSLLIWCQESQVRILAAIGSFSSLLDGFPMYRYYPDEHHPRF